MQVHIFSQIHGVVAYLLCPGTIVSQMLVNDSNHPYKLSWSQNNLVKYWNYEFKWTKNEKLQENVNDKKHIKRAAYWDK